MASLRNKLTQAYEKEHPLDLRALLFRITMFDCLKASYKIDKNIRKEDCHNGEEPCLDDLQEPRMEEVINPLLTEEDLGINKGNLECHRKVLTELLDKRDRELGLSHSDNAQDSIAA